MTDERTIDDAAPPLSFDIQEGNPPRGDLIDSIKGFVEDHLRPALVSVVDPVSGVVALGELSGDGFNPLPGSIFDDYLEAPRFRRGTASLGSLDSFIAHVERFKSAASVIFADDNRQAPKLTAVLDYHPAGADAAPSHGKHRSLFAFPLSDEWKAWRDHNDKKMGMADFAQFLEDRIVDVDDPDSTLSEGNRKLVTTLGGKGRLASPTKLVELSTGLQVNEASAIKESVKLSSGEGEISFVAEHQDATGAPLVVPSMFLLAIPIFRNGPPYQVLARLRYRKTPNGLVFWYELSRTDRVFDHAFEEAVEKVSEETNLLVLRGSPEA